MFRYKGPIMESTPARDDDCRHSELQPYPSGKTPVLPTLMQEAQTIINAAPLQFKMAVFTVFFAVLYAALTAIRWIYWIVKTAGSWVCGRGYGSEPSEDSSQDQETQDQESETSADGSDSSDLDLDASDYEEEEAEFTDTDAGSSAASDCSS